MLQIDKEGTQTNGLKDRKIDNYHRRDDIDRLYVSRKEGGRGLSSIEHYVDASIKGLEDYIKGVKTKHNSQL